MDPIAVFTDKAIESSGVVSDQFRRLGINSFVEACDYVHQMPYGYNSDREDLMILFKEGQGSFTTKHAVIATLAQELGLAVEKTIGIYAMTETIVDGTDRILTRYSLPYLPMAHCFLIDETHRVDLTEGNCNGKNCSIQTFLYTRRVDAHISGKAEYLLYREGVKDLINNRVDLKGTDLKTILHAREEGLALLKAHVAP